jgi:hypothetical protein
MTTRKYGLDSETWTQAKAEVRDVLIDTAKARALITYGEVTQRLQALHAHPGSYVFTALLREVCGEIERDNGLMLCALVVAKATGKPGAGYFRGMACEGGDLIACWQAECNAVYDYYAED